MSGNTPVPGWGTPQDQQPPAPPPAPGAPTGIPPKRPLWKSPKAWGIGIVVVLVLGAIGSLGRSRDEVGAPATGSLTITSPQSGDIVDSGTITVRGTGPAGARIVRDISFAQDDETVSDSSGAWEMTVDLSDGANELVFRVGDDEATAKTLAITFTPVAEVMSASPVPVESPASEPSASDIATVTPEPTAEAAITPPPRPAPTLKPTPTPTPKPTPAPKVYATFDDGLWSVGDEIAAGTYRLREPTFGCYWARLKGFGGSLGEIIANANVTGYGVVAIGKNDAGFESNYCGTWSKDLSRVTESRTRFGEGTFIVNTDIKPGTFKNTGGGTCYWARLKNFGGTLGSITANGLTENRTIVTIKSTDKGFVSSGCGEWVRR